MGIVNIENITDVVINSLGKHGEIDDRQREIMSSLLKHLHGFIKDVKLQHHELLGACDYLARAGKLCNENRQEFILLGDILGVEVLVDMMTNPIEGGESESIGLKHSVKRSAARNLEMLFRKVVSGQTAFAQLRLRGRLFC